MAQNLADIRAVFVDLDGTLLNKQHRISDYTAAVVKKLKEEYRDGVAFVVATGRPFHYVLEQIASGNIPVDYVISSNGCRIHHGENHSLIRAHSIPPQTVERLFHVNVEQQNVGKKESVNLAEGLSGDVAKVQTMSSNLFIGTRWLTNYMIANLGGSYPPHMQPSLLPPDIMECLRITNPLTPSVAETAVAAARSTLHDFFQDVHMLFYYGPHDNLVPAMEILKTDEHLKEEVTSTFSLPHIIDIYPRGLDKSSAVREVLEILGVEAKDAIAFGDGQNDITMLKAVGRGFVMSNSQDSVKAALPDLEVIGCNDDDGVAKKLAELFALRVPPL